MWESAYFVLILSVYFLRSTNTTNISNFPLFIMLTHSVYKTEIGTERFVSFMEKLKSIYSL